MDLSQPIVDEEPNIEVLFNACYGGYRLPEEAVDLYKIRCGIPDTKRIIGRSIPRHDPVLVQLFKEFPELFTSSYSLLELEEIPSKFADFYTIREYDGAECVHIDREKHALYLISTLVDDPYLSAELKLDKIGAISANFKRIRQPNHLV